MIYPHAKYFWLTTAALGLVEVTSWLAYTGPRSEQLITLSLLTVMLFLAWKRPVWLAYATVAELVIGSKGYLFILTIGGQEISIRMLLFAVLVLIALPEIRRQWNELRLKILGLSYIFFIAYIATAVFIGVLRYNSLSNIYTDANAFLYLALLPAWWVVLRRDPNWRQNVMTILLAGTTIIGLKSWLMMVLFGQNVDGIRHLYDWIRNTGVGEITYINANIYRVFFQSQIYSLLIFCLTLVAYLRQRTPRWWFVPMAMSGLGIYISLSRSFWLGLLIALLVLVSWVIRRRQWGMFRRLWVLLPLSLFAWSMMVWALSFPYFTLGGGQAKAVVSRLGGSGPGDAAAARKNQIRPLLKAVSRHPVIGSGFGTTVTYYSTDPRIRGNRTTTAFELGYLDLWLKLGAVGLWLYAAWLAGLWRRISRTQWSGVFLIAALALLMVNLTSPFLNHPLGLGWFMLMSLYAYDPV